MIARLILEFGPWSWVTFALILLGLEIIMPGVYLLWIGIAALIIGALSLLLWESAFWVWQVQVLCFLFLSLACAYFGKKIAMARQQNTDQPLLNRRSEQMIGRTATLNEPIQNGRGRIQLGDTLWRVTGPDLPAGTRVRVTGVASTALELTVEALLD
ncbi:NfeD family protein [Aquamicrobium segne]|uniref:NfeD family protein n=1 Tax=Aquamicrobium segne TaxID=469547 RepID=A0ABW0GWV8_9HYPH